VTTLRASREVVVVGAGLAGLAAACRLAASGASVRVFERETRAGGRVAVVEHEGLELDPTASSVTTGDRALFQLVREAGLAGDLLPLRPWLAAQADGSRCEPVSEAGLLAIARVPGVRLHEALRLARLPRLMRRYARHLDPDRTGLPLPEAAAPLDDRSLADFGGLYFGRSVVDRWMEPWLAERSPVDPSQASRALFLLRWYAERGAVPGALRGTPGLLAERLASRLDLRAGVAVARVEAAGRGRLRIHAAEGGEPPFEADAVVLALPAPEARRVAETLLAPAERDLLGSVRYDAELAWLGASPELAVTGPTRVRVPRVAGSTVATIALEPGRSAGGGRLTVIASPTASRAWLDRADDVVAKELAAQAERLIGSGLRIEGEGIVRRWEGARPRFDVGRYRDLARLRALQTDLRRGGRRLYFAGDHLAAPTIEGAVASGLRAADDLLADRS
jgi:oxygen-dependent protoporphyrinogen oxidase